MDRIFRHLWMAAVCFGIGLVRPDAQEITLYVMEVPPYSITNQPHRGILGEITEKALDRTGLTAKIVTVPNARAIRTVPGLTDTLIIPLARTKDREANFTWIAHILDVTRTFYTLGTTVTSFAEAKATFKLIGVERGSAGYSILLENGFPESQINLLEPGVNAAKMLADHRIDAWYNVVQETRLFEKKYGIHNLVASVPLGPTEQYLAGSKNFDPVLAARLKKAVASLKEDGTAQKIIDRYLVDEP